MPDYDPEQSDLLLYHVRILEEKGDLSEALTLLDMNAKSRAIVDRVAVLETRGMTCTRDTLRMTILSLIARILSKKEPGADAEQAWRALIERNPDDTSYYHGFFGSQNTDLGDIHPIYNLSTKLNVLISPRSPYRCRPSENAAPIERTFATESSYVGAKTTGVDGCLR